MDAVVVAKEAKTSATPQEQASPVVLALSTFEIKISILIPNPFTYDSPWTAYEVFKVLTGLVIVPVS